MKLIITVLLFLAIMPGTEAEAKKREAKSYQQIIDDQRHTLTWFLERMKEEKQIQEDVKLLAEVIYWENWHTDSKKLTAYWTGAVVRNRVKSKKYPNTYYDVIYEKGQYTTTKYFFTKKLPKECYEMADNIVRNGTPDVPENVYYQATFYQGTGLWKKLNGEVFCYG